MSHLLTAVSLSLSLSLSHFHSFSIHLRFTAASTPVAEEWWSCWPSHVTDSCHLCNQIINNQSPKRRGLSTSILCSYIPPPYLSLPASAGFVNIINKVGMICRVSSLSSVASYPALLLDVLPGRPASSPVSTWCWVAIHRNRVSLFPQDSSEYPSLIFFTCDFPPLPPPKLIHIIH